MFMRFERSWALWFYWKKGPEIYFLLKGLKLYFLKDEKDWSYMFFFKYKGLELYDFNEKKGFEVHVYENWKVISFMFNNIKNLSYMFL